MKLFYWLKFHNGRADYDWISPTEKCSLHWFEDSLILRLLPTSKPLINRKPQPGLPIWKWQQTGLCHFSVTHVFPREKKEDFVFPMSGCVCCRVWMFERPPRCLQENQGSPQENQGFLNWSTGKRRNSLYSHSVMRSWFSTLLPLWVF